MYNYKEEVLHDIEESIADGISREDILNDICDKFVYEEDARNALRGNENLYIEIAENFFGWSKENAGRTFLYDPLRADSYIRYFIGSEILDKKGY